MELLGGRIDLPSLAEALARDGRADLLTRRDGAWLLSRSLVIRPGASLEVHNTTLRLRSAGPTTRSQTAGPGSWPATARS